MDKITQSVLRLYTWMRKHKAHIGLIALLCIACSAIPSFVFAEGLSSDVLSMLFQGLLGFLTWLTSIVISAVGKLIVTLLGALIIPILGYNNFGSSTVIDIGWPLVRDVVNMFVILVLIVIAIQTIIGYKKAKWEQQLPRFFIAVVLVNFSRTICLLMIDVSQVIMFTFVNALRNTAAGNFMSLFQLNEFVTIDSGLLETVTGTDGGLEMYKLYITSMVILALLFVVLGTLIILTIVYIYRIVILWVLVILSPIAFFLGGITELFSDAGGKYKEWWSMFTAALTVGPLLTFFLWLALATASSGPIATTEGMDFSGTEDVPSLFAEIFMSEKLVSLLLALVLIMTGFKIASGAAQKMGNIAAKLITEETGKRLTKFGLTGVQSLGYRGARTAARTGWRAGKAAGGVGMGLAKRGITEAARQAESRRGSFTSMGEGVTGVGAKLAKTGMAGRFVGGAIMRAGGQIQSRAAQSNAAARDKARDEINSMTMAQRAGEISAMPRNPETDEVEAPLLESQRYRQDALLMDLATNADSQKQLKEQMGDDRSDEFDRLMQDAMRHAGDRQGQMTEKQKSAFKKTRAGNLRHWIEGRNDTDAASELDGILSDETFRASHLTDADVADERIQEALKQRVARTYRDRNGELQTETMWDQIERGRGVSNKVQNAAQGVGASFAKSNAAQIAQALKHGHLDASAISTENIADQARREEVARAVSMSDADLSGLSEDIRESMLEAIDAVAQNAEQQAGSAQDDVTRARWQEHQAQAQRARFSAMSGDQAVRDQAAAQVGVNNETGAIADEQRTNVRQIIQSQPTQIFKFQTAVNASGDSATEVSREIARSLNVDALQGMQNAFRRAQEANDDDAQARIRSSIETAMSAFEKEQRSAGGAESLDNETRNLYRKMKNIERYSRPRVQ